VEHPVNSQNKKVSYKAKSFSYDIVGQGLVEDKPIVEQPGRTPELGLNKPGLDKLELELDRKELVLGKMEQRRIVVGELHSLTLASWPLVRHSWTWVSWLLELLGL
jgi:hypothetical protein